VQPATVEQDGLLRQPFERRGRLDPQVHADLGRRAGATVDLLGGLRRDDGCAAGTRRHIDAQPVAADHAAADIGHHRGHGLARRRARQENA
jgi:hypothetical protein